MTFSNAEKAQHGQSAQNSLKQILEYCKDQKYISKVISNYRVGKSGFTNKTQFYASFLIEFLDTARWALFTTTYMRTDRIIGQQWDAKRLKEIDCNITSAYLIYPDGLPKDEQDKFIKQCKKYLNREDYSAIDAIVSQDQIANLIEDYSLKDKTDGQKKDIQGNNFEERITRTLSYSENLQKWRTGSNILEGLHYDTFQKIIECFELNKNTTETINATSDKKIIGKLPSGGNPKTDVLVTVTFSDGSSSNYTISCKRSSDRSVSVHQYTAESFSNVLDPENDTLKKLLHDFQAVGSIRALGKEKSAMLEKSIAPYVAELSMWALGGQNGDGNPDTQWANYILTYDNNEGDISIHKIADYCELLAAFEKPIHFGTPFSWTYPSKRRGKSIQLKCKILK